MNALISFAENLVKELSVNKNKTDLSTVVSLKKGIGVLRAITDYNKTLLDLQGLTIEDVSRHDKDIVTHKRKPIRVHGKSSK